MSLTATRTQALFILGLLLLAIAGSITLAQSTPHGLGLVNDSAAYIGGAMNLLEGRGYSRISGGGEIKPITHFPPLYSILLAGIGLTGIDLFQAARFLNVGLFALNVILLGLSVYRISTSALFALFGASLLAFSDVHLEIYAVALSEPLFLVLMLASYLLLADYFKEYHWIWLAFAGFVLGLAYLVRYAAISLWVTAVLSLILLGYQSNPRPSGKWLRPVLILLGSGLPVVLIWSVIEMSASGGIGNRQIAWHPVPLHELFEALKNLLTWAAPDDLLRMQPFWGRILSAFSLLLLPLLIIWLVKRYRQGRLEKNRSGFALSFTLGLHTLVYMAFLVLSISLLDASIPFDDRLLSVIYLPGMILFTSGLAWSWQVLRERNFALSWIVIILGAALLVSSLLDSIDSVSYLSREGIGFTNRGWRESPALPVIEELPAETVIYSDRPTAIFLLTGHSAYTIPTSIDPVTTRPRPDYAHDQQQMHEAILSGSAVLVLFDLTESRESADIRLVEDLTAGLSLQHDFGTVTIYGR